MFRKFNLNFASAAFHFFIEHFFSITFKVNFKSKGIFFIKAFLKWKSIIISRKTFWAKASNICTRDKENVLTYFHSIWKEQKHSYEIDNEKKRFCETTSFGSFVEAHAKMADVHKSRKDFHYLEFSFLDHGLKGKVLRYINLSK